MTVATMTRAEMALSVILDDIETERDAVDERLADLFAEFTQLLERREDLTNRRRRIFQEALR